MFSLFRLYCLKSDVESHLSKGDRVTGGESLSASPSFSKTDMHISKILLKADVLVEIMWRWIHVINDSYKLTEIKIHF